jgi:hypothetical protein
MQTLIIIGIALGLLAGTVQAGTLQEDGQELATYKNLGYVLLGLGAVGLAYPLDNDIDEPLQRSGLIKRTSDYTNVYGDSRFNLPISLSIWLGGKVARRPHVEALGSNLIRALAWTQMVIGPIKWGVARERPSGHDKRSFPSGHTANCFAMGRVLHRQYGIKAGLPIYVVGGLVAAGRIEDRHHHFSDVVMGAILGTIVGNSISFKQSEHFTIEPALFGNTPALSMAVRW